MDTFRHIDTWIFDLDNTLYPAECRLFVQIEQRMNAFISENLNVSLEEAHEIRVQYHYDHGTTLSGLMAVHDMAPEHFLDYVHDIDLSNVMADPHLDAALDRLPGRKVIHTNGSAAHAARVMERLGVADHFDAVFDIAAAGYIPKPSPQGLAALVSEMDVQATACAMFDDIARNLVAPHHMGMKTVWIRTGEEWSHEGADDGHIHHQADRLPDFLHALKV